MRGAENKRGSQSGVYRLRRARHKGSSRQLSRAALRAGAPLSHARAAVAGGHGAKEMGGRQQPRRLQPPPPVTQTGATSDERA